MPITYDAPKNVSVGTGTTVVLAANAARKAVVFSNAGANDIFLAFGEDAVLDKGIRVAKTDGQVTLSKHTISTQAINGIARTGATTLSIQEANS